MKIDTHENIEIRLNEYDYGLIQITVDGYDYAQFQSASIENIDIAKLRYWIEETYYTGEYKSDCYIPCDLNIDEFSIDSHKNLTDQDKRDFVIKIIEEKYKYHTIKLLLIFDYDFIDYSSNDIEEIKQNILNEIEHIDTTEDFKLYECGSMHFSMKFKHQDQLELQLK